MRVVEIGAGSMPGPFFEDASEHYIADVSEEAISSALSFESRFTPIVGDAARLLTIADESTDIVLARNVFGDPSLGVDLNELRRLVYSGRARAVQAGIEHIKVAIMQEAARILVDNGKLVIVEQYTPFEAEDFIKKLAEGTLSIPQNLSFPRRVDLSAVTPENYYRHHEIFRPRTWVASKIL